MTKRFVNLLVSILCLTPSTDATAQSHSQTPEQTFLEWTTLKHDVEVYKARRDRLTDLLAAQGVDYFLVPASHGRSHGGTFRQTDDFLYFTGLELPFSVLVIDVEQDATIIYAPARDARFESASRRNDFPGRPLADDPEIANRSGIDAILEYETFESDLADWVMAGKRISVNLGGRGEALPVEKDFIMDWNPAMTLIDRIHSLHPGAQVLNSFEAIARLRMVKGPEEIEIMREVAKLTADAIRNAAGFVREGVDERSLEAELEATYKRGGAQRLSFSSIIKSGPNSLWPWRILAANHDRRNREMVDGDLVIFDVGTELDYYVSDVGRTFPVSGTFSEAQAQKLNMMTSVADAIIAAARPGVTLGDLLEIAHRATPENEKRYMQTGSFFGHHIGMSAGDPSLLDAVLEPGMIFTVEPWYYNHDLDISVFVEDIVLVTEDGAEVLTSGLPRDAASLEKMVGLR